MAYLAVRRRLVDRLSRGWTGACLALLLLLPLAIGLGLVLKSLPLWREHALAELLLGSVWSPQEGQFGFYAFILSSVWVTALSFLLAAPVCLLSAIYLTQYAPSWLMQAMYLVIDVLAGVPSVVYGVWGVLVVVPLVGQRLAPLAQASSTGYTLLAGGIVLAVMCIPYILNMLIEVFRSIPPELKEASTSLGATDWETVKWVLLRQGAPGIMAAMGLGISKALGETIAVLMVVGNVARVPHSVFDAAYPLPALLANNYGDMMSVPSYEAALLFSALILFVIIILFNGLANLLVLRRSRD